MYFLPSTVQCTIQFIYCQTVRHISVYLYCTYNTSTRVILGNSRPSRAGAMRRGLRKKSFNYSKRYKAAARTSQTVLMSMGNSPCSDIYSLKYFPPASYLLLKLLCNIYTRTKQQQQKEQQPVSCRKLNFQKQ